MSDIQVIGDYSSIPAAVSPENAPQPRVAAQGGAAPFSAVSVIGDYSEPVVGPVDPNPQDTHARTGIADALSKHNPDLGWNAIANSTDAIAEKWTGQRVPATNLWQRVRNSYEGLRIQGELDDLSGKQYLGDASPETEARVKDLQTQRAKLGPALGNVPQFVAGMAYQLGYQGWHATEAAVGLGMGIVDVGLSALTGGALNKSLGFDWGRRFLTFSAGESSKVFGSLVGGAYRSLIDRGVDPTHARIFSAGLGALQVALMAIPIGGEAASAVADAAAEGTLRAALKGTVDEAAKTALGRYLGMQAGSEATAAAFGKQALFAIGMSSANAVLPEVAVAMTNRSRASGVEGERTGLERIANRPFGELAGEAATGALGQFLVGSAMVVSHEALRAMVGPKIEASVREAVDRETAAREEKAQGAKAPAGETPAGAEAPVAPVKIGDILDEIAGKGKETPEEQLRYYENLDREVKSAEGSADYVKGSKELERANITIEDLQARLKELPGEIKARQATRDSVNTMTGNMRNLDTSHLANDSVVSELERAVSENQGKPLFTDYTTRLERAKAQNTLRLAVEGVRDQFSMVRHTTAKLTQLYDIKDAIENGTSPGEFREQDIRALADLGKKNWRDLSPEEMKTVHDMVMGAKHTAEVANQVVVRGLAMDKDVAVTTAAAEMRERAEIDETNTRLKAQGILAKTGDLAKGIVEKGRTALLGYQSLINHIFRGEATTGHELLVRPLDAGTETASKLVTDRLQPFLDWQKEMKRDPDQWLSERQTVSGGGFSKELERGHIIAMNGLLSQENGLESLMNRFKLTSEGRKMRGRYHDGTPAEFFDAVKAALGPEEKKFLDLVFDMGKKNGADMKPVFMRLNGYEGTWLDQHYPFHRVRGGSWEQDFLNGRLGENNSILPGTWDGKQFRASVSKSHVIERVNSKAGLWVRNVKDDITDMITFAANYTGLAEPVRNSAKVLFDEKFAREIEARHGPEAVQALRDGLRAVAGNLNPYNWLDRTLLNIRRRGILGALGFNVPNALLNRSLMMRAMALGVPVQDMAQATGEMAAHPIAVRRWWSENSSLAHDIITKGSLPELFEAARSGKSVALGKVRQAAMAPERWGFGGAAVNEMQGSLNQATREMREGHLSENVAIATGLTDKTIPDLNDPNINAEMERQAAGIQYAEWVAKRSHAVPREMYQSNLSRMGIMGKLATTLYSERSALLQMGSRVLNSGQKNAGAAFMRYIAVGVFGEALAIAGIRYGVKKGQEGLTQLVTGKQAAGAKEDESFFVTAAKELANQLAGFVPTGAGIEYQLQQVITSKAGQAGQFSVSIGGQVYQAIAQIAQDIKRYSTAKSGEAKTAATFAAVRHFGSIAAPYGVGLPWTHGLGDVEKLVERGVTGQGLVK